jgi:hypothetical protein
MKVGWSDRVTEIKLEPLFGFTAPLSRSRKKYLGLRSTHLKSNFKMIKLCLHNPVPHPETDKPN